MHGIFATFFSFLSKVSTNLSKYYIQLTCLGRTAIR